MIQLVMVEHDLGRLRHNDVVISAWRALLRARRRWYPIMVDLHKFMVVVSRIEVNHDGKGGTALDPMTWDKCGLRKSSHADVWRYSMHILLAFTTFLASLHWPQGNDDLGKFGISYFEPLIMFEQSVGHRLPSEKVVRPHLRARRPLVGTVFPPPDSGCEIKQGCQFLQEVFRSLGNLAGGLIRFIPCQPGAHHTRLLHVGWGQCGHGLTSRRRESCEMPVIQAMFDFFN